METEDRPLARTNDELTDARERVAKAERVMQGVEEELAEAKRAYSALIRTLRDRWDRSHYDHERARAEVLAATLKLDGMIR